MKILTEWLRSYLPALPVDDAGLAEDLTLRGIAVEGISQVAGSARGAGNNSSLFEMDITTNRVDAMNHYGIAREAAAIYDVPLAALETTLPAAAPGAPFPVRIDAPKLCGRFTARVVRGVSIGPTTGRTAAFFKSLGQKSISNAVDISNLVLLGMGHPNHVFDLDRIEGGIVVRNATPGEQIKLLDGSTRTLVGEDLVIADERKALSLAGVMGGFDSMITAETKNILIEAAWFDPATIRATSRRHLLHTDASHRYERGADFGAPPVASALVARELLAACGGILDGPLVDLSVREVAARTSNRPAIRLSLREVHRMLGATVAPEGITAALVERYLAALGCQLSSAAPGEWTVRLPSWRLDLEREIDLIEEIARVYGYNRFANTIPTPAVVVAHPTSRAERLIKQRLYALGFTETISSTFANEAECTFFAPAVGAIAIENPLTEDDGKLRPSLLPGMVTMLAHNLNRDVRLARLFEAGAIFSGSTDHVDQYLSLSLGITGEVSGVVLASEGDAPFFELKGALESLLGLFDTPVPSVTSAGLPKAFDPGRGAVLLLGERPVASLGRLAADEAARRKLRQPAWLAELSLAALLSYPLRSVTAHELSRFQAVERDFSFTFPDPVTWLAIEQALLGLAIGEMQSVTPVELFRDAARWPGVYSTLVRVVFQSSGHTLTDDVLAAWSGAIIAALEALGGKLRGA